MRCTRRLLFNVSKYPFFWWEGVGSPFGKMGGDHFQAVASLVRRFQRGSKGARGTVLEREEREPPQKASSSSPTGWASAASTGSGSPGAGGPEPRRPHRPRAPGRRPPASAASYLEICVRNSDPQAQALLPQLPSCLVESWGR